MRYVRLYETSDGESHFSDVEAPLAPVEFIPGNPPLGLSVSQPATETNFISIPLGWPGGWHPTPRRQFWCTLAGEAVVTVSDGDQRHLTPGAVVLLEDLTGRGHHTQVVGDAPFVGPLVAVPE